MSLMKVQKASEKIHTYKKEDKYKVSVGKREGVCNLKVNDIRDLIKEYDQKCVYCGDEVLISDYKPFCVYQYSLDRIDRTKGHMKDNLQLACYSCNAHKGYGYRMDKDRNIEFLKKIKHNWNCTNGCHGSKDGINDMSDFKFFKDHGLK